MVMFCKFGAQCAYKHIIKASYHVQKQPSTLDNKESQNNLRIKHLEEEVEVLRSQIL